MQTPHRFLLRECERLGIRLPAPGDYAVGCVFLPTSADDRKDCEAILARVIREREHARLAHERTHQDNSSLGPTAKSGQPVIRQIFIGYRRDAGPRDGLAFERKLFVIRRRAENDVRKSRRSRSSSYASTFRACRRKTLIYKGMLNSDQVNKFYP